MNEENLQDLWNIINGAVTFIFWECQKEKRKKKKIYSNNGWKLLKAWEKYRHLSTWRAKVSEKIQTKDDFTKMYHNKTVKYQRQTEFWKQQEKKSLSHIKELHRSIHRFLSRNLQTRREQDDLLQVLKENNCQPRILYLAELSFRNEGERKTFPDKQKLKEFITTRPAIQEMLKGILQAETKAC